LGIKSALLHVYDTQYKKLLIVSFLILFACIAVLITQKVQTGEFIAKGVSLKGGLTMTIPVEQVDVPSLQSALSSQFPLADINVRSITEAGTIKALIIEAADVNEDELVAAIKSKGIPLEQGKYSVEVMGSSLGQSFYKQTIIAVIVAFVFMSIVVFVTFRNIVPSLFVILTAVSDITSTIAAIDLLGVKLSTAGVAALLMLIGYSVDTDILLTTKVLKRKEGTIFARTVGAMRTGLLMSVTAFGASMAGYFYTQSDVVKQIMLVISIGMIFDIIYTWIQNAGILRWYLESKEKKGGQHGQA
jgi:preprotein translocase subunit SecF